MIVRRALLSVSDKTGIVELGRALAGLGVELISTGGTATALRAAGLAVTDVAALTGQAEILGGRVKTLHPKVHGALLAKRDDPKHAATLEEAGIAPIDLLVVNLYPFEATLKAGAGFDATLEQIDVGGPAMLRAAAKNHAHVLVVTDPDDYAPVLAAIGADMTDDGLRRRLARKAFARTAAYDAAIAAWLGADDGPLPAVLNLGAARVQSLRYGENPHQDAALYRTPLTGGGVADAAQLQGKPLSYNNLLDADAAIKAVAEHDDPACVIVKHTNPCGLATAATPREAYAAALACDPSSAFGGIVALNRPLDAATAAAIVALFAEVVVAPEVGADARPILAAKPNLRVLVLPDAARKAGLDLRAVGGGLLVQTADTGTASIEDWRCVTARAPDPLERAALAFAWRTVKHVRSNAIVLACKTQSIGIGAGQMSRVDAVDLAVRKAGAHARPETPWVLASDAFFPFADGVEAAADAGVRAVVQPGGSVRDEEVIAAADRAGIAMLLTGQRHFRH